MTPDDDDKTPDEKPKRRRRKPAAEAAGSETPATEVTGSAEASEDVDVDSSRVTSAADAPEASTDEPSTLPEEPEPAAEADDEEPEAAPAKPARRRRRGAAAAEEEEAVAPAPARRRERPAGPPPVVRAQAKYVRSSPRKARLVCDHIRGKTVEEARAILAHTPRSVAKDWSKLLESAVANAEHNHELVGEDLYVKAVHADDGPTIKRFRPRAMGRATKIRKRTSHLTILLTPKG